MPITARYPSHISRIQAAVEQIESCQTTAALQAVVRQHGTGNDRIRSAIIKKIQQLSNQ